VGAFPPPGALHGTHLRVSFFFLSVHYLVPSSLPLFSYSFMAVDVITLNVPFLLGLDTLDRYKMYVNNITDELVCVNDGISLPTIRSDGHVYYSWEWRPDILYTFSELVRIHRHFFHASPERLCAVMRRSKN